MATKKIEIPMPTTGYGYAGVWCDGKLGWFAPKHVSGYSRRYAEPPNEAARENVNPISGDRFFLCKVTLTPVKDKNGRPVTKIVKRKKP